MYTSYLKARKKYYDSLIRARWSGKVDNEEIDRLSEQFSEERAKINEEDIPLFEVLLEYEDTLLNSDEEEFLKQVKEKRGRYYDLLVKREELYKKLLDKQRIINKILSLYPELKPAIVKGALDQPVEVKNPEKAAKLLAYLGIPVKVEGNKLVPASEPQYEVIYKKPKEYVIPKEKLEEFKKKLEELEKLQLKMQLDISLKYIVGEEEIEKIDKRLAETQKKYVEMEKDLQKHEIYSIL
ncbi:MAG: hypothetical protein GXN92_02740, partial [Candidatus Micrarchaeota archaeon]|nr:hypothetical protein [Candidatus Micrarchaeota archaeon]